MGVDALLIVIKERKWILFLGLLVGTLAAVAAAVMFPKQYRATAHVQVGHLQQNLLTGSFEPRVRIGEFLGQQSAVAGSRTVALKVYDQLIADGLLYSAEMEARWREQTGGELTSGNDSRLWAADQLLKKLDVLADPVRSTLSIAFRSDDASQSAFVANAFANYYMETILAQRQRRAARNAENFHLETKSLQDEIEVAQRELTQFRRSSGIVGIGRERFEESEVELATVTMRLAEARVELAEAQSLLRQSKNATGRDLLTLPLPQDAISGRQAQSRLGGILVQIQRLGERFDESYPTYVEALSEKRGLEATVLRAIRDHADFAARRVTALSNEAAIKKTQVVALQETKQIFDVLEKRVDASRDTYDLVASRSLQESLQSRVGSVDVLMLARAVPPEKSITPPAVLIVILGAVVGLVLGVSSAVALELMEGRIRSADSVKRILRAPVVGQVDMAVARSVRRKVKRASRRPLSRAA